MCETFYALHSSSFHIIMVGIGSVYMTYYIQFQGPKNRLAIPFPSPHTTLALSVVNDYHFVEIFKRLLTTITRKPRMCSLFLTLSSPSCLFQNVPREMSLLRLHSPSSTASTNHYFYYNKYYNKCGCEKPVSLTASYEHCYHTMCLTVDCCKDGWMSKK